MNTDQLERKYETYLDLEDVEHSGSRFTQYLNDYDEEICPEEGIISYVEEQVECSLHSKEIQDIDEDEEEEESVPYL
ncbi:hypothetical protein ACFYKX_14245 [Cytobacillus sp. FJAT-54145]|uniref:Uncharacterized protein n=1 Tax=Cytobacillus spartinae TaxID=3299023 RepID=A0ABW6KC02_9BACI